MPKHPKSYCSLFLSLVGIFLAHQACADDETFFSNWLENVGKTQEEQPHWVSPMVTATPRLEQSFRYDISREYRSAGVHLNNFGGSKAFRLIVGENTEIGVSVPTYVQKNTASSKLTGWADETLQVKYRMLSANEEHGNYIASLSLGLTLPTGADAFSNHHTIITPTLAAGKGWGGRDFGVDIQSTLSASIPSGGRDTLGIPLVWSTALQVHVGKVFWPEIEATYTHWEDGVRAGKNQLAMTYGIRFGRFTIDNRVKAIFGLGYETVQGTEFESFNHILLVSARLSF